MKKRFRLEDRASGTLLHLTSLPGEHGCGDLGDSAYRFVDFLAASGQRWWQTLPVTPADRHGCPYSASSAFAGDPTLVSLHRLYESGLLQRHDITPLLCKSDTKVDYAGTRKFRYARLRRAFDRFLAQSASSRRGLERFRAQHVEWLSDWSLFSALRHAEDTPFWWEWDSGLRQRRHTEVEAARTELKNEIAFHDFVQFQFAKQWSDLKKYANQQGVGLIGDIPIFVDHDSCDAWANPELFHLRANGTPSVVSGAAPDDFSETGQLWNHPLYNWRQHKATGNAWWIRRIQNELSRFDAVRVDHILGFTRYWEISAENRDPRQGRWRRGPGMELFTALEQALGKLPIIAEDLGLLTPETVKLLEHFGYPGMRVLQAGFDTEDNYHAPHNHPTRCVSYTGTHDNDTIIGWFRKSKRQQSRALKYMNGTPDTIHLDMIRASLGSPASLAITPMQDFLGLGNEARMNIPGTLRGNWRWRFEKGQIQGHLARDIRRQMSLFGRI